MITLIQISLYIKVDKENSLESLLIRCTLLIHVWLFVLVYWSGDITYLNKRKRKLNIDLEDFGGSWYHPPFKGFRPKDFFIVCCMGPLGHPYQGFHSLVFLNTFYLLLFSVNLPCLFPYSTLLSFLSCIHFFLSPFSLRTDFCYILKMDFFSTFSNSSSSSSNTPNCIFYCPIYREI